MDEKEVPFIEQPRQKTAAQLARETEIRLAREQPDPAPLPPIRRAAPEPVTAGTVNLPFQSPDRFAVHFSHQRQLTGITPRPNHCVACGYDKLETRLGDPEDVGVDPRKLSAADWKHFGPGEKEYGHCKVCFDTNGVVVSGYFKRWNRLVDKEALQYTLRSDRRFGDLAERVAAIDSWRNRRGVADLNAEFGDVREASMLTIPAAPDNENGFDGFEADERVPMLSEFTDAKHGMRDPEFGALYDPRVVGAAEAEAYMMDGAWEAERAANFRRAGLAAQRIEDPQMLQEALERLVTRWDPRMSLAPLSLDDDGQLNAPVQMLETNKLEAARKRIRPYSRSAAHSGVDEGFSTEPGWKQSAIARHEAAVADFMAAARRKLAQREGMTPALLAELTTLPELNPGREVVKLEFGALRDRPDEAPRLVLDNAALKAIVPDGEAPTLADRIMALRSRVRPTVLAPAAELDRVAEAATLRASVADDVNRITVLESAAGGGDREKFRLLAEAAAERRSFQVEVRAANAAREEVLAWASSINREDVAMRGATKTFATEIRSTFADPEKFQAAFKKLSAAEQREALTMLREQPTSFAEDFAKRFHRDFGPAGEVPRPDQDPHAFEAAFSKLSPAERGVARKMLREQPDSFPQDFYTRFQRDFGGAGEIARPDAERAGILVANAGEGYLDAKLSRDAVRRVNAERLGLPETASLDEVKQACRDRFKEVNAAKQKAIAHRDAVQAPTRGELTKAFSGLHPADRTRLLAEMPALQKLVPSRRQRELARSGPGL